MQSHEESSQRCMTHWNGKLQKMVPPDGIPKGLRVILQERGINTTGMKLEDIRKVLSQHSDFQDEQPEFFTFCSKKVMDVCFYQNSIVKLIP